MENEVSKIIYSDFLPDALANGNYFAAPSSLVLVKGLDLISSGLEMQKKGVSAQKLVITL